MSSGNLSFSQVIKTDAEGAYRAFTNATELRGWLCNVATVVPRPGGRLYLWWESGYYTSGEYITAEPGRRVSFTWSGKDDPAQSKVEITFSPQDGGTLVKVSHQDLGSGPEWNKSRSEMEKGWSNALENLNSVVTTGEDLRFVTRPMLGIIVDDFNEEVAKKLGMTSADGIRLGGTVAGMGAEAAGLKENDVIVSMGGMPTINFETLNQALTAHKAGDTVEVIYFRGGEQQTLQMKLSGRPIPEIPTTAQGLAEAVGKIYRQIENGLEDFLSARRKTIHGILNGLDTKSYSPLTDSEIASNFSNAEMSEDSPFRVPWWYRTEFTLPAEASGRNVWLRFGGINYKANVWLNGERIAAADDSAGSWRLHDFDVTGVARAGQANALAVLAAEPPQWNSAEVAKASPPRAGYEGK
jgi:uncharacterized protein YndB with AHSA1/START domain/molybdopterin-guanine dinucleotide biosynthesis protein A